MRPSAKPLLPWYGVAVLAAVLPLLFAEDAWRPAALLPPLAIVIYTAIKQFALRFQTLMLEGGRLRFRTGMLSRSTRTMELVKVQDVRVDQSVMQRIFSTGDLSIESAGESSRLTIHNVDRPQEIADRILAAAQGNSRVTHR